VSQNKIVSTIRGNEVVCDPTNVLAPECAARLSTDPTRIVKRLKNSPPPRRHLQVAIWAL
jgi:hypothetical protein